MIRNMGISDARTDGTQVDYRAAQSQLKMLSSQTFFGKFDIENVHFLANCYWRCGSSGGEGGGQ